MKESTRGPLLPGWASGALVLVVAGAAIALTWTLASQNRQLKEALARIEVAEPRPSLSTADIIPPISILNLDGMSADLLSRVEDGGVIAFLTTTCKYCIETLPLWTELHEELRELGVPFVGISLHDLQITKNFALANSLAWPVWVLPDLDDARRLKIAGVPMTVLVSPTKQVLGVWRGALTQQEVARIREQAQVLVPTQRDGRD